MRHPPLLPLRYYICLPRLNPYVGHDPELFGLSWSPAQAPMEQWYFGTPFLKGGQCDLVRHYNQAMQPDLNCDMGNVHKSEIGENIRRKDKIQFLINTLLHLKESKDAVYVALDAWVAWENKFPIVSPKRALAILEKEQQWHRIIQESEGKLKGILGYIQDDVGSINFVVDCRFVSVCCTGEGIVSRHPCDILLFVSYFLGFYILILY
ncbi:uncharacterized protein LOC110006713 isoform X3 [Amborella trichopoda]|uniref:uncharacterized protein LOC110006713 isoform X3 n=1 Tax=Amborella trichopoda TaxID=13333 RepID=UPI0009BF136C|nr:uncharacterized protein LOC110006713 isoform X3 [Amborella trichopoda]|eukprot:XP_020519032.1 uncharacterized protein LOC110006713 isoform X3 [Amborella trichopoda]